MASKWLWCIFQLPLMSGFLGLVASPGIGRSSECGQAGEVAVLDELEAGAAAGGHVVDVVVEAELGERAGAVAAADDGEGPRLGAGLRHGPRAGLEAGVLEHAHGPVPEDGAGL